MRVGWKVIDDDLKEAWNWMAAYIALECIIASSYLQGNNHGCCDFLHLHDFTTVEVIGRHLHNAVQHSRFSPLYHAKCQQCSQSARALQ